MKTTSSPTVRVPLMTARRAGIDDDRRAEGDDDVDRAGIERLPGIELQCRAEARPGCSHEAAIFLLFLGEGLHHLDRGDRPLDERVDAAVGVANLAGDGRDLAVEERDEHEERRNDGQRQQRQHRIERHQHEQHAGQEDDGRDDRQQPVHDHGLDGEAVGGHAIHEVADLLAAVKGQRQALQMAVERARADR